MIIYFMIDSFGARRQIIAGPFRPDQFFPGQQSRHRAGMANVVFTATPTPRHRHHDTDKRKWHDGLV
jgi:hypothetical protein